MILNSDHVLYVKAVTPVQLTSISKLSLIFAFITKSLLGHFYLQKSSKFFACSGHLLGHKPFNHALELRFFIHWKNAYEIGLHYQIASSSRPVSKYIFRLQRPVPDEIFLGYMKLLPSFKQAYTFIGQGPSLWWNIDMCRGNVCKNHHLAESTLVSVC